MREVHEHPQTIHLQNYILSENSQAMVFRLVTGSISPIRRFCMSQCHVADAELVHHPQYAERVVDGMPAFQANQRSDLSLAMNLLNLRSRQCEPEGIRVPRYQPVDHVNLLERRFH